MNYLRIIVCALGVSIFITLTIHQGHPQAEENIPPCEIKAEVLEIKRAPAAITETVGSRAIQHAFLKLKVLSAEKIESKGDCIFFHMGDIIDAESASVPDQVNVGKRLEMRADPSYPLESGRLFNLRQISVLNKDQSKFPLKDFLWVIFVNIQFSQR